MNIKIIRMDEVGARQVLSWRYEEPYSFYNPDPKELEKDVKNLTDANNSYFAGTDQQRVNFLSTLTADVIRQPH